jgi:hypothetical protein
VEVLASLVILAVAGVTFLHHLTAVLDGQSRQLEREREFARAERLLTATLLLSRVELEQRLGVRPSEDLLVWVDRPEPFLFRVGVSAAARPEAELLATLAYRRGEDVDEP